VDVFLRLVGFRRALESVNSIPELFDLALDQVINIFPVKLAAIYLFEPNQETFQLEQCFGSSPQGLPDAFSLL